LRAQAERRGWSFVVHRTDRSPNELLLALHARMSRNLGQDFAPSAQPATDARGAA
jgi:hypothetical protein